MRVAILDRKNRIRYHDHLIGERILLQRLSLPSSFELGIVAFIAFIIFLGSSIFAIHESVQQARLVLFGTRTDATVVQVERIQVGRSSRLQITLRFTTEAAVAFTVKDVRGVGRHKVDDKVPVIYIPSNPAGTVVAQGISGFENLFLAIGIAFVSGLVFVKMFY